MVERRFMSNSEEISLGMRPCGTHKIDIDASNMMANELWIIPLDNLQQLFWVNSIPIR